MEEKLGRPAVVEIQYELAAVIIKGWTKETSEFQPFPPPSQRDQIHGTYLAVHHAVSVSVGCMRKRRQQEQRQQVCKLGGTFSNQNLVYAKVLTAGLPTLIAAVYAKTSIIANVSGTAEIDLGGGGRVGHGREMKRGIQNIIADDNIVQVAVKCHVCTYIYTCDVVVCALAC